VQQKDHLINHPSYFSEGAELAVVWKVYRRRKTILASKRKKGVRGVSKERKGDPFYKKRSIQVLFLHGSVVGHKKGPKADKEGGQKKEKKENAIRTREKKGLAKAV